MLFIFKSKISDVLYLKKLLNYCALLICIQCTLIQAATMAQWVRAFVLQGDGWVFESQARQTLVVKIGSDSFIAKRSAIGIGVAGRLR